MSTPKTEPVRWGIIGCGAIATHAICPALRWSPLATLESVASRDLPRAQVKQRETGAERCHGSYADLLADPAIEAVYIGLPNGLHEEWTIAAAKAGKHVLCEKSLALTSSAARRMVQVCSTAGVRLMEGFMYRHHPQWDVVRRTIADGTIGEVRLVRAGLSGLLRDTENHRWSATMGGGALYDVTCYALNVARFLYRSEPLRVLSFAERGTREAVDRTSIAMLEFAHGRLAMATGSLDTFNHQFCEIEGTNGRIVVEHPFIPGWEKARVHIEHGMNVEMQEISGANHFLHMLEHFSLCVRDPRRPLEPGEDGLAQSLLNEAVEQAWTSGKSVEIELV